MENLILSVLIAIVIVIILYYFSTPYTSVSSYVPSPEIEQPEMSDLFISQMNDIVANDYRYLANKPASVPYVEYADPSPPYVDSANIFMISPSRNSSNYTSSVTQLDIDEALNTTRKDEPDFIYDPKKMEEPNLAGGYRFDSFDSMEYRGALLS